VWVASAILAALAGHAQEARPVVVLRVECMVAGPEVLLGQVADLQADAELAAKLAAISLGSAPVAGTPRRIETGYIKLRLRRYGIDPGTLTIQGEAVTVRREATAQPKPPQAVGPGLESPSHEPEATDGLVLVKRGQLVEVLVQCRGVCIHTAGVAGRDAGLGELVDLRLEKTGRKLVGRVDGPGRAVVALTAGPS
jgi:hypothetical protein